MHGVDGSRASSISARFDMNLTKAFLALGLLCQQFFCFGVYGQHLEPWFGRVFEIEPTVTLGGYRYSHLDTSSALAKSAVKGYKSSGALAGLSLAVAPWDRWSAELEQQWSSSHKRSFSPAFTRLTGRYALSDDTLGGLVSTTAGLSIVKGQRPAVYDVSAMLWDIWTAEVHVACGREWAPMSWWHSRVWGAVALGQGTYGSPYSRFIAAWEGQNITGWQWGAAVQGLWGWGTGSLTLRHFEGYSPVAVRTLDGRGWVAKRCDSGLTLQTAVEYRFLACNAPAKNWSLSFSAIYPFGL